MYYVINYNNGRLILLSHGTLDDCLLKFCRNVAINPKVTIRYLSKYHIFEHKGVYIVAHSYLGLVFNFNIGHYHSLHYNRGNEIKIFLTKKIREIKIDNIIR